MTERHNYKASLERSFTVLPPEASAFNLSAEKTYQILKQIPMREAKMGTLTLLFSRQLQEAKFIRNKYGLTPEAFSETVTKSFRPLFDVLPSEYAITPIFDCNKWKPLDELEVYFSILSRSTEVAFERLGNVALPFAKYLDNRGKFEQDSEFCVAGDLEFRIFQEREGEVVFDQLYGEYTHLLSREELENHNLNRTSLPVVLRHCDGQTLGISDAMKESQERLIGNLAEKSGHVGLISSIPQKKAVNLLARRGYSDDVDKQFPEFFRGAFRKTSTYTDIVKRDGVARVIYIPKI